MTKAVVLILTLLLVLTGAAYAEDEEFEPLPIEVTVSFFDEIKLQQQDDESTVEWLTKRGLLRYHSVLREAQAMDYNLPSDGSVSIDGQMTWSSNHPNIDKLTFSTR